ncbi:bifunctional adenosylcobinamide kinase/adenosylcobinamide-phosphate guanylyltransferase [Paracoccus sp. MKU1]|uniref:bifunctional adenosylcobinamide kinase/adenosylcobinamide-phosphate guanylyltransferase n=1 Tax=Paracoccus sp. MKU1 TaxID=1745182 RepID=UPI0007193390|nr:bifunctional adenosylcobinamide kinase/adenosylcobinamide-phosphate guanylyltransferase [Paracoccus sp. MKU1]KRW93931.1 adenosylcobinamide kinase [Paracoccus sp. MKU1]
MSTDPRITMVTGGARSGKSALAESLAARHQGARIYIATAEAWDDEMTQRIGLHRTRRGGDWQTVEESRDLAGALARTDGQGVRLVDCLTLWLSNLMADEDEPGPQVAALCRVLGAQQSPVVLVTNELGLGIVPENALARRFRDEHGWMNQAVAGVADEVWMAVSGMPLRLKPQRGTS